MNHWTWGWCPCYGLDFVGPYCLDLLVIIVIFVNFFKAIWSAFSNDFRIFFLFFFIQALRQHPCFWLLGPLLWVPTYLGEVWSCAGLVIFINFEPIFEDIVVGPLRLGLAVVFRSYVSVLFCGGLVDLLLGPLVSSCLVLCYLGFSCCMSITTLKIYGTSYCNISLLPPIWGS